MGSFEGADMALEQKEAFIHTNIWGQSELALV